MTVLSSTHVLDVVGGPWPIATAPADMVYLTVLRDHAEDPFRAVGAASAVRLWSDPGQYHDPTISSDTYLFALTRAALSDTIASLIDLADSGLITTADPMTTAITGNGIDLLTSRTPITEGWDRAPLNTMACVYFTTDAAVEATELANVLAPLVVENTTPTNVRVYGPADTDFTAAAVSATLTRLRITHHGIRRRPADVHRRHLPALPRGFWEEQAKHAHEVLSRLLRRNPLSGRAAAFDATHELTHGSLSDHLGTFLTSMARVYDARPGATYTDYCIARFPNWITDLDDSYRGGSGLRERLMRYNTAKTRLEQDLGEQIPVTDARIQTAAELTDKQWQEIQEYLVNSREPVPFTSLGFDSTHDVAAEVTSANTPGDHSPGLSLPAQAVITRAVIDASLATGFTPTSNGTIDSTADALPFLATYLEHWCNVPKAQIYAAANVASSTMRYRTKKTYDAMRKTLYEVYLSEGGN